MTTSSPRSRLLRLLAPIAVVLAMLGVARAPAEAVGSITGRMVHYLTPAVWDETTGTYTSAPTFEGVMNVSLLAYAPRASGGPGKLIGSTVSDSSGYFSLPVSLDAVCLEIRPPTDWVRGWYWPEYQYDFANLPQFSAPPTCDVPIGPLPLPIALMPAWGHGTVLNQNGAAVAGATVRYVPVDAAFAAQTVTTAADGTYRVSGLNYDEYEIRISGPKLVSGYLGCGLVVVSSPGDACTFGAGDLDHSGFDLDLDGVPDGYTPIHVTVR